MNEKLMIEALSLAEKAEEAGEVPVGCVIADRNGNIIGRGRNRREEKHDASSHAEIEAIREACDAVHDWRLDGCSLYVTLEPCPMCAGAIINARISEVVFGARDPVMGSSGSVIDLFCENYPNHPHVFQGINENESRELLQRFFRNKRRSSFD
ncbi:MAG: nucleoside deaminase [Eubacteriales bacterium]|nr:nucleoside deaminase [Eubacteriales bacterium]